jgi:dihydrodipicolinate synthase/N-acetylneuraminate lyase
MSGPPPIPASDPGLGTLGGDARRLRGALAAAVTPFTAQGGEVDLGAIGSLAAFYAAAGLDGLLVLGTTGEGILLAPEERRRVAEQFLAERDRRLQIVVHCGAQSTRDSVELAAHAAELGADGVAAIPPPYFALDEESLFQHLLAISRACAPTPFYVYEFQARSGYAVPPSVLHRLRESVANLQGLKVSDYPFERVQPYLTLGLDVFIGAEALIERGLRDGAVGAVSGLAAALPELTIAAVREGSTEATERAGRVRQSLQSLPFHAALKTILGWRGVSMGATVRPPLRGLNAEEEMRLRQVIRSHDVPSLSPAA